MIEFKGPNANLDEKRKSINELPDDIGYFRNNFKDINLVWGYIITSIDDKFEESILNQGYIPLFSNSLDGKNFYRYLERPKTHVYIIEYKTIVKDAFSRNQTFLDILEKNYTF